MVLNNSNGFSIVSAMVGAAVGGVVMLAMSQMLISQQESVSYLEDRLTKVEVQNRLRNEFVNSRTCLNNFRTKVMAPKIELNDLVDSNGDNILSVGSKFDHLEVVEINTERTGRGIAANGNGRMDLIVQLKRLRGVNADKVFPVKLELQVGLNGVREISSCGLLENGAGGVGEDSCIVNGFKASGSGSYVSYRQIIPDGQTMQIYGTTSFPPVPTGRHPASTQYTYLTERQISCSKSLPNTLSEVQVSPPVVTGSRYIPDTTDGYGG